MNTFVFYLYHSSNKYILFFHSIFQVQRLMKIIQLFQDYLPNIFTNKQFLSNNFPLLYLASHILPAYFIQPNNSYKFFNQHPITQYLHKQIMSNGYIRSPSVQKNQPYQNLNTIPMVHINPYFPQYPVKTIQTQHPQYQQQQVFCMQNSGQSNQSRPCRSQSVHNIPLTAQKPLQPQPQQILLQQIPLPQIPLQQLPPLPPNMQDKQSQIINIIEQKLKKNYHYPYLLKLYAQAQDNNFNKIYEYLFDKFFQKFSQQMKQFIKKLKGKTFNFFCQKFFNFMDCQQKDYFCLQEADYLIKKFYINLQMKFGNKTFTPGQPDKINKQQFILMLTSNNKYEPLITKQKLLTMIQQQKTQYNTFRKMINSYRYYFINENEFIVSHERMIMLKTNIKMDIEQLLKIQEQKYQKTINKREKWLLCIKDQTD